MASFIPPNFTPRQDDYIVLQREGIPRDFLDVCVTQEFIEFWTELKEKGLKSGKKSAWFTTYRKRARHMWKLRGPAWEENRHKRRDNGGLKTDLFGGILDRINGSANRDPDDSASGVPTSAARTNAGRYRLPDPPKPGPAMSPTEAFDQLKKMGHLK